MLLCQYLTLTYIVVLATVGQCDHITVNPNELLWVIERICGSKCPVTLNYFTILQVYLLVTCIANLLVIMEQAKMKRFANQFEII